MTPTTNIIPRKQNREIQLSKLGQSSVSCDATPIRGSEGDALSTFYQSLFTGWAAACEDTQPLRVNTWRFPQQARAGKMITRAAKNAIVDGARRLGFLRRGYIDRETFATLHDRLEEFEQSWNLLGDQYSRELFVRLLLFRVLGERRVKLPRDNEEYWEMVQRVGKHLVKPRACAGPTLTGHFDLFRFDGISFYGYPLSVLETYLLEQYRYSHGRVIEVRGGDVAIDAGGCWGETSLYFAARGAQVFAFEFEPKNLVALKKNLALNPDLAGRITVVERAAWDSSGQNLRASSAGAGSRVSPEADSSPGGAETLSIDDMVCQYKVDRVDFIKMDIEGAELRALEGARSTIQRCRPKLALAVYHNLTDFITIPQAVHSILPGYRLFLDHFTTHTEETILFAEFGEGR